MLEVATEIRSLPRAGGESSQTFDRRVERSLASARSAWADSPSRSASVIGEEDAGYEIGPVYEAIADYYVATGRPGRALRLLEEACDEARALRYYAQWQDLTIQLVRLYEMLGMVDHARDRIAPVLRLLARFGYSLDSPPNDPGRDQVVFLELHTARLAVHPESYANPDVLRKLYALFRRSTVDSVEAWGWAPDRGLGFMGRSADFAVRLAGLGDLDAARRIRTDVAALHARNRGTDPFVLVNERRLDFAQTRLGRDVQVLLGRPFATSLGPLAERIGSQPAAQRRFLVRSPFLEAMDLARIDLALGDAESARVSLDRAAAALAEVEAFYERSGPGLSTEDRLPRAAQSLGRLRAEALESLGRETESEALYAEAVRWSEGERESLPVELRIHFFRGQARSAYQGAVRTSLKQYLVSNRPADLERALRHAERMRSRAFQDLLGVGGGEEAPLSIARLQERLDPGQGLLQLLDLDDALGVVLISREATRARIVAKEEGFEREVFRLRNRLAEEHAYDARGFGRLGTTLLGFLADDLMALDRLYVTLDGALTSLPPSILPFEAGRLLHDQVTVTLVPSLSLWLGSEGGGEGFDALRALVVAAPVFEGTSGERSTAHQTASTTRGSAALAYFQPLPETADEARSILASLGGDERGTMLLGRAATESSVKAVPDLSTFTHLHFATHGVIGSDLPGLDEPALVLGWESREDGLLTATEVAALDLDARLTVLSACNTGNGEYFAGEGLMGLGRAFMLAGSDRVVVSLWPVESFSTQRLMELFYARLAKGENEERALWHAQHALRRELDRERGERRGIALAQPDGSGGAGAETPGLGEDSSPFYWSPFVLISTR